MGKIIDLMGERNRRRCDCGCSEIADPAQSARHHGESFCREIGITLEEYVAILELARPLWPLFKATRKNPRLLERADVRRLLFGNGAGKEG